MLKDTAYGGVMKKDFFSYRLSPSEERAVLRLKSDVGINEQRPYAEKERNDKQTVLTRIQS
jgi:hypothetical protein